MKIRFLGPIDRVTGSCYWLIDEQTGFQCLIDCGMMQGEARAEEWNRQTFPFEPRKIDCVILTHAHLDHCGLLPLLVRQGFVGPVWCTRETRALARIILLDAAKLSKAYTTEDVLGINFREPNGKSLYGKLRQIGPDVFAAFSRSPHILGAVSVQIVWGPRPMPGEPNSQRSIVFSGDLGVNVEGKETLPLLRHAQYPYPSDYLVLESTYGARSHGEASKAPAFRLEALEENIDGCVLDRKGVLVVTSFAVGRPQDILFDLHLLFARHPSKYRDIPVVVHAPMAMDVSDVYGKELLRTGCTREGVEHLNLSQGIFRLLGLNPETDSDVLTAIIGDVLHCRPGAAPTTSATIGERIDPRKERPLSQTARSWRRIHQVVNRPVDFSQFPAGAILVTSGGMCEGGPVHRYLPDLLPLESTTVLFTGYQSPGTLGAKLQMLQSLTPAERARLTDRVEFGEGRSLGLAEVRADLASIHGYSGHLDQEGLLKWMFQERHGSPAQVGRRVFLTHGQADQRRSLERAISMKAAEWEVRHGVPVHVCRPSGQSWFDLNAGAWCHTVQDNDAAEDLRKENQGLRAEIEHMRHQLAMAVPCPAS